MEEKFKTKKSLGQHFLTSSYVPRLMCETASVGEGDTVLEIGPGTGVLTHEILSRKAKVIALEADPRAIEHIESEFASYIQSGALTVIHTDVRELKLQTIAGLSDHKFKIIANIPYYLSGLLFRTTLQSDVQPSEIVFLVQKEVAKRITADQKKGQKESLLSLSVKVYGTPLYVKTVSKGHFSPPPKIDSAIIHIKDINRKNFDALEDTAFFTLIHRGFAQKRKQLLGNLSKYYNREALTNIFSTCSIPISTRAEDVPLQKWLTLAGILAAHKESTADTV